jgi:hypothetical protein
MKKPRVRVAGPLSPYINGFAGLLNAQGFTRLSIDSHIRLVKHFSLWLAQEHVDAKDITPEHADAFFRDRRPNRGDRAVLKRVTAMLRNEGIIVHSLVPAESEPTPVQRLLASGTPTRRRDADLLSSICAYLPYREVRHWGRETLRSWCH